MYHKCVCVCDVYVLYMSGRANLHTQRPKVNVECLRQLIHFILRQSLPELRAY